MFTVDVLRLSLIAASRAAFHSGPRRLGLGRIWAPTIILATAVIASVAAPTSLHAQADSRSVGKRVVPMFNHFALGVDNEFVADELLRTYLVEKVNGPWLWLHAEGFSGWAKASEVLPVERAVDYFTNAIRNDPSDLFAYSMRAMIRLDEKKELDLALADQNEAIRLNPMAAALYICRGVIRCAKKDYDEAIVDYDDAIRLDRRAQYGRGPHPYAKRVLEFAYYGRGSVWYAKKDYNKAIADYDDAIRIRPRYAEAYLGRGLAWCRKREYDRALADYAESIRIEPKSSLPYINVAWLRATCHDARYRNGRRAVESGTRACELSEWKEAYAVGSLAAAYAESGDFDLAVKWQASVNALYSDPEDKSKGETRLKLYQEKKPYRDADP